MDQRVHLYKVKMNLNVPKALQFSNTNFIEFEECEVGLQVGNAMSAVAEKIIFSGCTFHKPKRNALADLVGSDDHSE